MRSARRHLAHLPDSGVAERPGHLQHLYRDLDPRDHHLRRSRGGLALGRHQIPPLEAARRLRVQGTDVIHSWWVPAISGKTDAVPGYDNFTWLKVDRVGTWRGECAELCGAGHSTMQIIVQSMSQYDYDVWVRKQQAAQK